LSYLPALPTGRQAAGKFEKPHILQRFAPEERHLSLPAFIIAAARRFLRAIAAACRISPMGVFD
jgi:hypothetical protein